MNRSGLKILVAGRHGQIAWELQRSLQSLGEVRAVGRPEIDLAQPDSLRRMVRQYTPDVLINAAAYTAVDQAETDPDAVAVLNIQAPRIMAEEAKRVNALFITYSSDYVFDGLKKAPYTEADVPNPLNRYGASKLAGDRAVEAEGGAYLILRTSWVYGARGKNFLRTITKLATERGELRVVDDQVGAPTWSHDIAEATAQILALLSQRSGKVESLAGREGVYNVTAQGSVSWFGFASAILDEMRLGGAGREGLARLVPIPSSEYPTAAARPGNSILSNEKIRQSFGIALPQWRMSLTKVMAAKDELGAGEDHQRELLVEE